MKGGAIVIFSVKNIFVRMQNINNYKNARVSALSEKRELQDIWCVFNYVQTKQVVYLVALTNDQEALYSYLHAILYVHCII